MSQVHLQKYVKSAILAASIIIVWFFLVGNVGLNLGDEGHLWYGSLQTMKGAVPILDFRSYDPGRYYWAAGWMRLIGGGIVQLRLAGLIFYGIGLSFILLKFFKLELRIFYIVSLGVLLISLSFPIHKLYEYSLTLCAIYFISECLENSSALNSFRYGVFLGISAAFARNFALYFLISFFLALAFLKVKRKRPSYWPFVVCMAVGLAVGIAPIVYMMLFIPGYGSSLFESVRILFGPYAPVLPLSISWRHSVLVDILYLCIPSFYMFLVIRALRVSSCCVAERLLVACAIVGLPILHHVFVRADLSHLAQGATPFVVAISILPMMFRLEKSGYYVRFFSALVLAIVVAVVGRVQILPIKEKLREEFVSKSKLAYYPIGLNEILLDEPRIKYLNTIKALVSKYESAGDRVWIAPYAPGLYPILEKVDPVWDPYPLFPASEKNQRRMIDDLVRKKVELVIIDDNALDGINARRFSQTHSIVWHYLMNKYVRVGSAGLEKHEYVLVSNNH